MSGSSEAISKLPPLVSVREAVEMINSNRDSDHRITYHQFVGWINRNTYELGNNSTKVGHGIVIIKEHIDTVIKKLQD
jgi:hypothetical protein